MLKILCIILFRISLNLSPLCSNVHTLFSQLFLLQISDCSIIVTFGLLQISDCSIIVTFDLLQIT